MSAYTLRRGRLYFDVSGARQRILSLELDYNLRNVVVVLPIVMLEARKAGT